ncbi:MAG: DUF551 domain-containing protein [Gammaproteobacteria bacterium]
MSEWIAVADKMPGDERLVLSWGPMLGYVISRREQNVWMDVDDGGMTSLEGISHWCELPAPPEDAP